MDGHVAGKAQAYPADATADVESGGARRESTRDAAASTPRRDGEPAPKRPGQASDLRAVFGFVRGNWRFVAVCGACMMALAGAVSAVLPARYTATTALVVDSRRPRATAEQAPPTDDLGYVETQIITMGSDLVLLPVVRDLRLDDDAEFGSAGNGPLGRIRALLPGAVEAEALEPDAKRALRERKAIAKLQRKARARRTGTSFVVEIGATTSKADKSAAIANKIAAVFIEDQKAQAARITGRSEAGSMARTITKAPPPLEPSGPGAVLIVLLGGMLGIGGGVAVAALRAALDHTLKTPEQAEEAADLDCIGVLPLVRPGRTAGAGLRNGSADADAKAPSLGPFPPGRSMLMHAVSEPESEFSDGLRLVWSILGEAKKEGRALVVGFGPVPVGAGASTVAANMAAMSARAVKRTLLIDADPGGAGGLSQALAPPARRAAAGQGGRWDSHLGADLECFGDHLRFLSLLGPPAGADGFVDAAARLAEAVERGRRHYDFVFVDLPPAGRSAAAKAMSGALDAVVLVAEWGRAEEEDVAEALRLAKPPREGLGFVLLNKAKPGRA